MAAKNPRPNPANEFQSFILRRKLTPTELEKRLGIPRMTIWRWRTGKAKPSLMARRLVEEILGFKWPGEGE